jgi:glutamate N-acetyltransferase/amino-acid N-acetyltransferase
MTSTPSPALSALPSGLPAVTREPVVPGGFLVGGMTAGIKASGRPDLAMIKVVDGPAPVAGVFTRNSFAAAPVRLCRAHLKATNPAGDGRSGWTHGVVSTSGSANAATGEAGDRDQAAIAGWLAAALGPNVTPELTLGYSTGLIGTRLPLDKVSAGIATLATRLGSDGPALAGTAEAFRTTDSRAKMATTTVQILGPDGTPRTVRVSGIAKGVGMIHPRMATMLSVVMTDAAVAAPEVLADILSPVAARTWNQLSVDGDTSTNDSVLLIASGAAGTVPAAPGNPAFDALRSGVEAVARDLARQQAADGEGATTLLTCQVSGALDDAEARAIARAVISSSLVKAAFHGRDPNWGRIAGAAGNARMADAAILVAAGIPADEAARRGGGGVTVDPARLRIAIAGHTVYDGPAGGPATFDKATVRADLDTREVLVRLDLGLGDGRGEAFGCDLTEQYVIENSEYST